MLRHLKISTALSLGFAVALVIAMAIAGDAYLGLRGVEQGVTELSDFALPSTRHLATYDEARAAVQRAMNGLMLPMAQGEIRRGVWKALDAALSRLHQSRKDWEALPSPPETVAAWNAMTAEADKWEHQLSATVALMKEGDRLRERGIDGTSAQVRRQYDEQVASFMKLVPMVRAVDDRMPDVREKVERESRLQSDHAHAAARQALGALVVMLAIGAAILLVLAVALTRGIAHAVQGLTDEASRLTSAVRVGKLKTRAEVRAVHFQFKGVVEGMNETMEAYGRPVRMALDHMDRISRGDVPEAIQEHYEGDFDLIKQSVNRCIGAVGAMVQDSKALAAAELEGKLSTRADVSRHEGDFHEIIGGINATLDAVLEPIGDATQVLERLAERDLRARVNGNYQGDHAKIADALNATATALHDAMAQVAQAVGQVSSASSQIATASQAVAAGASEQASSIEETGSSLESISSTTKQAADSAQQASVLATVARGAASEGSAAMGQMTDAMGKIQASAESTSQIIKDINAIAFQTNLLALNAAVEAARAGEAGRGFAVVAEEVRSLALRSKEAANRTEELIRQSVKEAQEGAVTAQHVNQKLAEILGSVTQVTEIVAEISAAAKDQATGIDQVSHAVAQMSAVTQQNAASSEESSSAAAELSGQSAELAAMVETFQLNGVTAKVTTSAKKKSPPPALDPDGVRNGHSHRSILPPMDVPPDGTTSSMDPGGALPPLPPAPHRRRGASAPPLPPEPHRERAAAAPRGRF